MCAGAPLDSRAEQCAAFNAKEFMDRLYDWEPFTEGEDTLSRRLSTTGLELLPSNTVTIECYSPHSKQIRSSPYSVEII